VDDYSDYPVAAKEKPRVGGGVEPSLERIVALHPDLVIASASAAHPGLVKSLARLRIPLLVVTTNRAGDIGAAMELVGRRIGLSNAHASRVALDRALTAQRRTRQKAPRVLFLAYTQPIYVAGSDSFTADIIRNAGGENAVTVTGWPQYSAEALVADPPDVVLHPDTTLPRAQVEALFAKAPRRPEIVAVDEAVFSRPGPRIVDAASILNAILDAWEARGFTRPVPKGARRME
jgi:iron complex transport system substrate-binding protein